MLHFVQQVEQQGGLAHSRLCDQGGKSAPCFDRINQRCEGFRMGWTEIQIPRIGSDTEWLLAEPKIFQQPRLAAGFSFVIDGWHTIVLDTSRSNELAELDSPAWIGRWPSVQRPPPARLTHAAGINLNRRRSSQNFHGHHEPARVFFSNQDSFHTGKRAILHSNHIPSLKVRMGLHFSNIRNTFANRYDFVLGDGCWRACDRNDRANPPCSHYLEPALGNVGNKQISGKQGLGNLFRSIFPFVKAVVGRQKSFKSFCAQHSLHLSLMLVTRMERVPPNTPLLIVAVFLFPVHKASPLESQAEFPPLARSNSRTGFVGKIPFPFTVLPGPVQKIQLVANGSHRQLA